jgi:hypothetical protein
LTTSHERSQNQSRAYRPRPEGGRAKGIDIGEASWVLEDNEMSNRTIQNVLRPEHYKTYRIYEKPVVKGLPYSGVLP